MKAMNKIKRFGAMSLAGMLLMGALAGCGNSSANDSKTDSDSSAAGSTASGAIDVVSREDGSGTRGAFIELTGVEEKNADGKKVDNTTEAAAIQSSTNGVMTAVANDETAIGYISLGSLNDTVKAVTVGGVAASAETVKDGSYVLARPFNIVTNGDATDPVAVDFIAYCLSKDGQALATDKGYIGEDGADYTFSKTDKDKSHYEYTNVKATVDGKDVEVVDNGDGTYTMQFAHYEEVPKSIASKVLGTA